MISDSSRTSLRIELERLFKEHQQLKFPPPNHDDKISELNDLLVPYDSYVASTIMRILRENQFSSDPLHMGLDEDPDLQRKIDRLTSAYAPNTRVGLIARRYGAYYEHIKQMVHVARSYVSASRS